MKEVTYNVWELGMPSQLVDCRDNKADADYISNRLTSESRYTHVVTVSGSAFDKELQKQSKSNI